MSRASKNPFTAIPQLVPTLSAGHHRSAKRGACFMEFASFLAGERWSDSPACTDPVLATLARAVNDTMSDARRGELITDIPRVIGLRGDELRVGLVVALRAASIALPVASMERQRALAVGIIATLDALAELGINRPRARVAAEDALQQVPDATSWAHEHLADWRARPIDLARHGCGAIVRTAALGVAQACIDDPDTLLAEMLRDSIGDVEAFLGKETIPSSPVRATEHQQLATA
jgi:hypothetical protein